MHPATCHHPVAWRSRKDETNMLFITVWVVTVIVNGKKSHQQGVHHKYGFNAEWRSDDPFHANDQKTETSFEVATTQTADVGTETLQTGSNLKTPSSSDTGNPTLKRSKRSSSWFRSIFGTVMNVFKAAAFEVAKLYVNESQGQYTCHRNVCFYPEYGLGLSVGGPIRPEEENTSFIFFDSDNRSGIDVNETTWDDFFANYSGNISKPLVAIVHGLNGSRTSPWVITLKDALLDKLNCNVLQVVWQERARFPHYAKAASSAPLVGVLLSFMLQKMIAASNCSLHPDNVHLVGFSLGAHAAGVCGRHFYNVTDLPLGRITGLDPAGPLFEHSNVTLSKDDAKFVDVMHTNAGDLKDGRLGLNKSIGHVDFYPNGGSDQPNCSIAKDPACSHKRAQGLFIQSVYNNCSFKSYYCSGGWSEFLSGKCTQTENSSLIGEMGYHSLKASGRGNQYLNTTGEPPYCYNITKPPGPVLGLDNGKENSENGGSQSS